MAFHILAVQQVNSAPSIRMRLLLSAGVSVDEIACDLRVKFKTSVVADALVADIAPLRSLPSLAQALTIDECSYVPALPERCGSIDELMEIADEHDAISVHLYKDGEWYRVRAADNQQALSKAVLFRVTN